MSFPPNTSSKAQHKRIFLYLVWIILFGITLIPVQSILDWYNHELGIRTWQPLHPHVIETLFFIAKNLKSLFMALFPCTVKISLQWLLAGALFWLFLRKLKLPNWLFKVLDNTANKIATCQRKYFLIISFAAIILITCLLSYLINQFIPHYYPDNVVQFYQAKLFKSGRLYIDPPQHGFFFEYPMMIKTSTRWYPQYAPGYPFLLMLGLFAGMPWLVNPLLGAFSGIILYKLALEVYDEKTARLGIILLIISPFFLSISSQFYNHAASMLFCLLFIYYFVKSTKYPGYISPFLSGLFLGAAANTRPLTSLSIGLPLGIYGLYLIIKHPREFAKKLLPMVLGLAIAISVLLTYNYLTNGHPLLFGQTVRMRADYGNDAKLIGFGKASYGIIHTPFRAFVRMSNKLNKLNEKLFGWPIPSLLFVFLFFLPYRKRIKWDYLFLAVVFSLLGMYFCFFSVKVRYFYALVPLFILLTARGIHEIRQSLQQRGIPINQVNSACYVAALLGIIFMIHTRIIPQLTPGGKQRNILYNIVREKGIEHAVIFVGSCGEDLTGWRKGLAQSNPDFDGPIIYAHNHCEHNIKLMEQYPDRDYYLFTSFDDGSYIFKRIVPPESPYRLP
jgi:hypothetical protein